MPYAVVQLRQENLRADSYNLVGFQNHLKFGEQARVLRTIPASRTRGSCATDRSIAILISTAGIVARDAADEGASRVLFADRFAGLRLCRVDCHRADGGMHAAALVRGDEPVPPPRSRVRIAHPLRCSCRREEFPAGEYYLRSAARLERKIRDRKERHRMQCELALKQFDEWLESAGTTLTTATP